MKNIKLIISDLDGTLIDTEEANTHAYVEAFQSIGISITAEDYKKHFGLRFDKLVKAIAPDITDDQISQLKLIKKRLYPNYFHLTKFNEPLVNFLREHKEKIYVTLASTASKANALAILEYHQLGDLFEYALYGEDVTHGKPHPEVYQKVIEHYQVSPKETLIFEDSPVGLEAAHATGAQTIDITSDELPAIL